LETENLTPIKYLVQKLKLLKYLVISWERNKKLFPKEELIQIELDLKFSMLTIPRVLRRRRTKYWY